MHDINEDRDRTLPELTVELVCAYVAKNPVPAKDLPALLADIHTALIGLAAASRTVEPPQPAVPIGKSVTANYIVCLEDGLKFKLLKRHLKTRYGMTPEEYRAKWGLEPNYPMVAPNYGAARSVLAKKMRLGHTRSRQAAEPERRASGI